MASTLNYFFSNPFDLFKEKKKDEKLHYNRPKLQDFVSEHISHKGEKRSYSGYITSLNQGEGVVDNEIFFSTDLQSNTFNIGEHVEGEAVRESEKSAWRAIRIHYVDENWEHGGIQEETSLAKQSAISSTSFHPTVIGKVVSIYHDFVILDTQISVFRNEENCKFIIVVGDWLKCDRDVTVNEEDGRFYASQISPLRAKTVYGYVSHTQSSHYIINGEIYCSKTLLRSYVKLRERVIVQVMESNQGNCNWRAVKAKLDRSAEIQAFKSPIDLSEIMVKPATNVNTAKSSLPNDDNNVKNEDDKLLCQNILIEGCFEVTVKGIGYSEYLKLTLKNTDKNMNQFLENITIDSNGSESQLTLDSSIHFPIKLAPEVKVSIIFICAGKIVGTSNDTAIFNFVNQNIRFTMKKNVKVVINEVVNQVQPRNWLNRSGQASLQTRSTCSGRIIQGEKPFHASPFLPIKLPYAEVPPRLWEAVLANEDLSLSEPSLLEPLCSQNYVEKLSCLLYLEEIELEMQMGKFDIPCTTFERHGEFLGLTVEGLAEKRPSLMVGDSVLASSPLDPDGDNGGMRYEGVVHQVLHSKVLLKFHPNFHNEFNDEDYFVRLRFNRTPLRRCHLATTLVVKQLGGAVLFPSKLKFELPQVVFVDAEDSPKGEDFKEEGERGGERKGGGGRGEKGRERGGHPPTEGRKNSLTAVVGSTSFEVDKRGYCLPVLTPTKKGTVVRSMPRLSWFNTALNGEQKTAVKRILEGVTRPLPYVIFGPPGTGKTVTLVEALLQVYKLVQHSRILVATPTNGAGDLVVERAVASGQLTPGEIVRLNAFNRCPSSIPPSVSPFCLPPSDLPSVCRHRVIVCTAATAGLLSTASLRNGHFTHVFVDEAGQLTEPQIDVALGLVNSRTGQIVLAGDPKQLGPVVMSGKAKRFGLGTSLLHRLCASVMYQPQNLRFEDLYSDDEEEDDEKKREEEEAEKKQEDEDDYEEKEDKRKIEESPCHFEPRLVTLLVRNYRSHPALLRLPSALFYHSLLVPAEGPDQGERGRALLGWEDLPNPSCPLVFHPVWGHNQQEGDSPSWFNPAEAFQVCWYTLSLLRFGLSPVDIGVIAPYKKQVEKIRQLLCAFGVEEGVKVGPVEDFQGQERTAIILSTVRSSEVFLEEDARHELGFVRCSQRFNVAVTRAASALVVVGNPTLLRRDPNWGAFISYCAHKGAVVTTDPRREH